MIEKMYGWLGAVGYDKIITHDDDLKNLIALLNDKKGAVLITSHLGNIELLRSLTTFGETGVQQNFNVTIIMETETTEQFTKFLKKINPSSGFNVIDAKDISLDTICTLEERLSQGALVVYSADRTSKRGNHTLKHNFLGREALFPYGVFLLTILLNSPTFFVFGLREKTFSWGRAGYNMFVIKARTTLKTPKSKRDETIGALCDEFVTLLEKYCRQFPYQWYNFYNFWLQ